MPAHFTEADLQRLGRRGAVDAMRRFLEAHAEGRTHAPPRQRVPLGGRTLVFTAGADLRDDIAGFRMYSTGEGRPEGDPPVQTLTLLRLSTGEVLATAVGDAFGAWRTAALGAVALQEGTRSVAGPLTVGVLGAGFQAHHHTRTWAAAADVARFRVWARRPAAATAFAEALERDTGIAASAAATAAEAVAEADAVLAVTRSRAPVLADEDAPQDAYVATVGPKFGAHELPAACYERAAFLFSDAPAQCAAFERTQGPLPGGRTASEMQSLSDLVAGRVTAPAAGLRLFVSEGLAGTEVALLHALLT